MKTIQFIPFRFFDTTNAHQIPKSQQSINGTTSAWCERKHTRIRRFGRLLKKPAHAWIIYVVAASLEYEDSCTQRLEAIGMSLGQGVTCRERRCRMARSRQNQLISGVQRFRRNNMGRIIDQESAEIYRDCVLMDEEFRLLSISP